MGLYAGVKISRNAVPGPGNLSLERSACKIIGFHSRNPRSWAQQVSNILHSHPIVNESFKFHIFTIIIFTMLMVFTTKLKKHHEIMLNTFSRSLIIWKPAIETWAREMNGGGGRKLGARRAEQFPHLGNYTLTPAFVAWSQSLHDWYKWNPLFTHVYTLHLVSRLLLTDFTVTSLADCSNRYTAPHSRTVPIGTRKWDVVAVTERFPSAFHRHRQSDRALSNATSSATHSQLCTYADHTSGTSLGRSLSLHPGCLRCERWIERWALSLLETAN